MKYNRKKIAYHRCYEFLFIILVTKDHKSDKNSNKS